MPSEEMGSGTVPFLNQPPLFQDKGFSLSFGGRDLHGLECRGGAFGEDNGALLLIGYWVAGNLMQKMMTILVMASTKKTAG